MIRLPFIRVRPVHTAIRHPLLTWLTVLALSACGQQGTEMTDTPRRNELFGSPKAAALFSAASKGDLERARQLMAEGVSLNSANAKEQTLLKVAMLTGDRKAFTHLLDLGADPTYLGQADQTPMHLAAVLENSYWLKSLLDRKASTEVLDAMGETPLFDALGPQTAENVQLLLAAGANIHVKNRSNETLLHKAANIHSFSDVARFVELGVDPTAKDDLGFTFQYSFFATPERALHSDAQAARAKVRAWLRAHSIPVEEAGPR